MSANNRVSNLINTQVPFFVRNDHQKFITFLEKYYEFLEQNEGLLNIKNDIISYRDIDYVTRNNYTKSNVVVYSGIGLSNNTTIQSNTTTGNVGISAMILKMSVNAVSGLTGTDLNLYNFLSKGATSYTSPNRYGLSVADINRSNSVTSADATSFTSFILDGSSGSLSNDIYSANLRNQMLAINAIVPGYFNPALFGSPNVMSYPGNTVTYTETSLEQQAQDLLYNTFIKLFPKDVTIDKALLMKHAKEFYLTKGSEKSIRFLLNAFYGVSDVSFYYPKKDVLKLSDGKWYVQKSLRVNDLRINGVANLNFSGLNTFKNRTLYGNTSNAFATVERVDRFYEKGTEIEELFISNIRGKFINGETVRAIFDENGVNKIVTANVFGGIVNSVEITAAGSNYQVGQHPTITTTDGKGSGADIIISSVTSGNLQTITVIDGGAGYQNGNFLLISGGGTANANITMVLNDSSVHPNTYNIVNSIISLEANTAIGNARYSNLKSSILDPANNWIANSMSYFVYGNTGPAKIVFVRTTGSNYTEPPTISVLSDTRILELGILGRMKIINGGQGYVKGDTITFTNLPDGYGVGALANVTNVAAGGVINEVKFIPMSNNNAHIVGGTGYSTLGVPKYPIATVVSTNAQAFGANVVVTNLLGEGGIFQASNSTIGAIERVTILTKGSGYIEGNTFVDFSKFGDGKATGKINVLEGTYAYPGRYLNDDGHLSGYNFIQDRDYYQNFSYVIRSKSLIENYRKALKELAHPAGMRMFGAYLTEDMNVDMVETSNTAVDNTVNYTVKTKTYVKTGNTINISYDSHGLVPGNTVFLNFTSGGTTNVKNGSFNVISTATNSFNVRQQRAYVESINIVGGGLGYSNGRLLFSSENGKSANGTYGVDANGKITSVTITDYGRYYTTIPSVVANGTNTSMATLTVNLDQYANNTSGNVNVSIYII